MPGSPLNDVIEVQLDITRDTTGQVATLTALDAELGEIYNKTYDAAGRLTAVNSLGFSGTITYDAFGRQAQVNLPNNSKQVIYDTLNRVTGITWTGDTPISQQLTYNSAGNINSITRENGSYQIAYDNINQLLTSATTGTVDYNKTFQYDSMGNRTTNGSTYVSNFLTQNSTTKFDSDANGFGELTKQTNLSNNQFRTYQYRADGRMKELNRPAANLNVKYHYDALGRRIAKVFTEGAAVYSNYYFHEGLEDSILISVNGNDQPTFYIDGKGIDEHLGEVSLSRMSRNTRNTIKAYVTDHLGSVLNSDMAGTTKSFGLFGEPTATVTQTISSPAVRYGYTGREWDAESSTSYHRARNYDPNLGRWLTPDPIGLGGGDTNLYRYVGNSPMNYFDPSGLAKCIYSVASNSLQCTSDDGENTFSITGSDKIFSGNYKKTTSAEEGKPNEGPIVRGNYKIVGGLIEDGLWWALRPDSDTTKVIESLDRKPKSFWLHPGQASDGCLTVYAADKKNNKYVPSEEYLILQKLLKKDKSNTLKVID